MQPDLWERSEVKNRLGKPRADTFDQAQTRLSLDGLPMPSYVPVMGHRPAKRPAKEEADDGNGERAVDEPDLNR